MIGHLIRLLWNRKRANGLIVTEILVSFLVLALVATLGLYLADNYRRPLGFDYARVWDVKIDVSITTDDEWSDEQTETFARVLREVAAMPEVEAVAGALHSPYELGRRGGTWEHEGRTIEAEVNEATDGLADVLNLQLVAGRWFEEDDSGRDWEPIVLDHEMALAMFGDGDPIGADFTLFGGSVSRRVVGVVAEFRKDGELSGPGNYLFERVRVGDRRSRPPRDLLVKVVPGIDASFEAELIGRLERVARAWTFEIQPLSAMRKSAMQLRLAPVIVGAIIAGFLLLMVALGLVGVLWQNVTRRRREIGLRRALGATAADVQRQVLSELAVLSTVAMAIGMLLLIQLPVLDLVGSISRQIMIIGVLSAAAFIYLIGGLCAIYPSWLATRVHPVEALHSD